MSPRRPKVFATLIALGFVGAVSAQQTLTFSNTDADPATPGQQPLTVVLLPGSSVVIGPDGNVIAQCALTGSLCTGLGAVALAPQTTTLNPPPNITYAPGGTLELTATGGASGNPVVFASTTPTRCTVSGSTLTIVSATPSGQFCIVTADQAGSANYSAAPQVTRNITIDRAAQAITFDPPNPLPRFDQGTFQVAATGGASGNPIVFVSVTPSVCTVGGSGVSPATVTILQRATCGVVAQQAGNANYLDAVDVRRDIAIQLGNQNITFNPPASQPFVASGTFAITATGGGSTAAVVFSSVTPTVCSVTTGTPTGNTANGTVTMATAGTCFIRASQGGDSNFNPASSVTRDIAIVP